MRGQRWAIDLGADNYGLHGYFGKPTRWSYYRKATRGHNTLTFDDVPTDFSIGLKASNQESTGFASIQTFDVADRTVELDLAPAYANRHTGTVLRSFTVADDWESVRVVDVFAWPHDASNATWAMHTQANVTVSPDGQCATLTMGTERLYVALTSSDDTASWHTASVELLPPQNPIHGLTKLYATNHAVSTTSPGKFEVVLSSSPWTKAPHPILARPALVSYLDDVLAKHEMDVRCASQRLLVSPQPGTQVSANPVYASPSCATSINAAR